MHKLATGIGSLALVAGSTLFVVTANDSAGAVSDTSLSTAPIGASLAQMAVEGNWVHNGRYTDWQDTQTPPALADGEMIGEMETNPGTTSQETSDWMPEGQVPEGDGWVRADERHHLVSEEGYVNWQHYTYHGHWDGGPEGPPPDSANWHLTHGQPGGGPHDDPKPNVPYHSGQGGGSWHMWRADWQEAVWRTEHLFTRTVETPPQFRWQILEWEPAEIETPPPGEIETPPPGEIETPPPGAIETPPSAEMQRPPREAAEIAPVPRQAPSRLPAGDTAGETRSPGSAAAELPTAIDAGL